MKKLIFAGLMMMSITSAAFECKISIGASRTSGDFMIKTDCGGGPSVQVFPAAESFAGDKAMEQFRLLTNVYATSGWKMGADQSTPQQEYYYHRTFTSPVR